MVIGSTSILTVSLLSQVFILLTVPNSDRPIALAATSIGHPLILPHCCSEITPCLLVHTVQLAYLTTKTTLDPISLDAPQKKKKAAHADQTDPPESSLQEQPSGQKMISADEVAKHDSREDCWVIIQVRLVGFNRERVAGG